MLDFQIPRITAESVEDNRGQFVVEPLDRGFGYTFGNSLRRVLLASLAGAAVTSVRIEGVAHEFSTIKGVSEDIKSPDQPIGVIPIDSIFSPVKRVAYSVEQARVGQRTDFDKLTLDIETDGSLDPQAALREAAEILISSLSIFTDEDRIEELRAGPAGVASLENGGGAAGGPLAVGGRQGGPMDDILIEELELGVRSYNCLKRAGIQTVGDLISKSEGELAAIPNFGKKSIDEVIETPPERGLTPRTD